MKLDLCYNLNWEMSLYSFDFRNYQSYFSLFVNPFSWDVSDAQEDDQTSASTQLRFKAKFVLNKSYISWSNNKNVPLYTVHSSSSAVYSLIQSGDKGLSTLEA